MKLELLLVMCVIMWCVGVRLSPLENNDKLQDITNLYVAEWQWESWPIKQELSEQEGRSPGLRKNFALWGDTSKSAWYLFGGQPINGDPTKVYSDVWRFKVKTRVWKRFFPSQGDVKPGYINKKGGLSTLRTNLSEGSNASNFEPITHGVVLCGGLIKRNASKTKDLNEWTSFRRKKLEEDRTEELSSLAIYAPGTPKSNTVWQIDVKERLWTTYVCCCGTGKNKNANFTPNLSKYLPNKNKIYNETIEKNFRNGKNLSEAKINNVEDEVDNEQQHLSINNLKSKKKKINQIKKLNEKSQLKKINIDKRGNRRQKRNANETKPTAHSENSDVGGPETTNDTKLNVADKKEENLQKSKITSEKNAETEKLDGMAKPKIASKYCPEFSEGASSVSVTWCDGRNEALVTADVGSRQITVWVFNLTLSHWSQLQVKVWDGVEWPGCPNTNSIRYVGNDEEVYIICSLSEKPTNTLNNSLHYSTNPSKIPSDFNTKLVFRINYKEGTLRSLGKIRMNSYFNLPEGEKVWQNDTQSLLQVIRNSDNETILILAFLDTVDLWILNKNQDGNESFDLIEKIWRGSALKWFDKYNAALYSLQFVTESGNLETILLPNPRNIGMNEYWPRERGRFIIRVFRNENLKNQSFENRTREQNLTYELLQSDYKPSGAENQINHVYSLKVLVFFGISLAIFTVFGFVIFLKKCVNCPPRIRVRNECHKSPLVIRYSVIPDDLLYPVA